MNHRWEALRAAAEAALPGDWYIREEDDNDFHVVEDNANGTVAICVGAVEEDAAYIALASPSEVLALLDELAAAEARAARLEAALSAACGHMMNAKIDLETGTKRQAIVTLEGGLKVARAAISEDAGNGR